MLACSQCLTTMIQAVPIVGSVFCVCYLYVLECYYGRRRLNRSPRDLINQTSLNAKISEIDACCSALAVLGDLRSEYQMRYDELVQEWEDERPDENE